MAWTRTVDSPRTEHGVQCDGHPNSSGGKRAWLLSLRGGVRGQGSSGGLARSRQVPGEGRREAAHLRGDGGGGVFAGGLGEQPRPWWS